MCADADTACLLCAGYKSFIHSGILMCRNLKTEARRLPLVGACPRASSALSAELSHPAGRHCGADKEETLRGRAAQLVSINKHNSQSWAQSPPNREHLL